MSFWQSNNFRIDPWGLDYELPIGLGQEDSSSLPAIDTDIETSDWTIPPKAVQEPSLPDRLIFIDGRRRLDTRFVGRNGNEPTYGAFATLAIGAVVVDRTTQTAEIQAVRLERLIAFSSQPKDSLPIETPIPCPIGGAGELVYRSHPLDPRKVNKPSTPMELVQEAMRVAEVELALEFNPQPDTLVIQDGNLFKHSRRGTMLGYIKTMQKIYLPDNHSSLLWNLAPGERTPIFELGKKNDDGHRYSWYLRSGSPDLAPDRLGYHALHGLVRLELYADRVSLNKAIEIANQTTCLIPHYSSHPNRDPRAPQNLTPIGALEQELGRRMGDRTIISRRIQMFLAGGVPA